MQQTTNLNFISIQVSNLEESRKFYEEIIGFKVNRNIKRPDAVVFGNHNGSIFAIRNVNNSGILNPGDGVSLWFAIGDLSTFQANLNKSGVKTSDPVSTPFGDKIVFNDPDGYELTFHEYNG